MMGVVILDEKRLIKRIKRLQQYRNIGIRTLAGTLLMKLV